MNGYSRWSPFADLFAMQRDMNNLVSRVLGSGDQTGGTGSGSRTAAWAPPIESFYKDNQLVVRAWVPGIDPATVDVQVSGNLLTIKGQRTFPYQLKEDQYLFSEVAYGAFERTLSLPDGLQSDHVKASYQQGVLEIALPIHEAVLPKKVPIEITQDAKDRVALSGAR
jgi:HSP20 family protein